MKAQEYITKNYSKNTRKNNIKKLNISQKKLEGELDLSGFVNLKILDCSGNDLVNLKLEKNNCLEKIICSENKLNNLSLCDNNPNLTYLDCSQNNLSDINFITVIKYPQNLIYLNLRDNCFTAGKLDIFSEFLQIEELYLGTTEFFQITFTQAYNQFYGSLKFLKELKRLRVLCINNTEVNQGWEYLPINLATLFIADTREKITGEDLGIAEVLEEIAFYENDFRKWIESRKVKRTSLEKDLKTFQRLTAMWKEKYEQKTTELENRNIELEKLEKELEDLKIENSNFQIANGLIREKYEKVMEEISQLQKIVEYSSQSNVAKGNSVIQIPPK